MFTQEANFNSFYVESVFLHTTTKWCCEKKKTLNKK